jgi:hypothetical protein
MAQAGTRPAALQKKLMRTSDDCTRFCLGASAGIRTKEIRQLLILSQTMQINGIFGKRCNAQRKGDAFVRHFFHDGNNNNFKKFFPH